MEGDRRPIWLSIHQATKPSSISAIRAFGLGLAVIAAALKWSDNVSCLMEEAELMPYGESDRTLGVLGPLVLIANSTV